MRSRHDFFTPRGSKSKFLAHANGGSYGAKVDPTDANGLLDPSSLLGNLRVFAMECFMWVFFMVVRIQVFGSLPDDMVKKI